MSAHRQTSRNLGLRSFGSFGNRPTIQTTAIVSGRKPKTGRIHNDPFLRDKEEKQGFLWKK